MILGVSPDEIKGMSFREFTIKMMEAIAKKDPKNIDRFKDATIEDSKIEGDKATLTLKGGDKTRTFKLHKTDGVWYLDPDSMK